MTALPADVGLLFLAGCPRTGTTALQEYLNVHPQIMVGRERYKWIEPALITMALFEPEALLDFDEGTERYRTDTRRAHMQRILDHKDFAQLRWVGDKFPGYLKSIDVLARANPTARFLITHRDVEQVVNSYIARSLNADDSWLGGRDAVDLAINTWNRALEQMQSALADPQLRILVVPYERFHDDTDRWADHIGSFLDIEMPSEVRDEWNRRSDEHRARSTHDHLSGEIRALIEEKANRSLEAALSSAIG